MPRVKSSEFTAKKILSQYTKTEFFGIGIRTKDQKFTIPSGKQYVAKVDDGSKRRYKRGLVKVNISNKESKDFVSKLQKKGNTKFYIEPYVDHEPEEEQYISLERIREGFRVIYSKSGGIHVEDAKESLRTFGAETGVELRKLLVENAGLPKDFANGLVDFFNTEFIGFLEINPFVVEKGKVHVLDLAVERDDAADFYVSEEWMEVQDKAIGPKAKVGALAETTPASVSLEVIDENAPIFVLFSGGGASLVLADSAYHRGHPELLATYGEYSGNPTREVIREYAGIILDMLLQSKAKKKALVIAGGVANFTDILQTFSGIVDALEPRVKKLTDQKVKVFVRRGGPNEEKGRAMLEAYLTENNLLGSIGGSKVPLTKVMDEAISHVVAGRNKG